LVNAWEKVKAAGEKRDRYRAGRRPGTENRLREVARPAEQAGRGVIKEWMGQILKRLACAEEVEEIEEQGKKFNGRQIDLEALISKQLVCMVAPGLRSTLNHPPLQRTYHVVVARMFARTARRVA
jgi:hypothetical protein